MHEKNGTGHTGLLNLGNTCFINSFLQIINHMYELEEVYDNAFPKFKKNTVPETVFFKEWIDLHDLMWEQNGFVTPHRFIQVIQQLANAKDQELFTDFSQNDIHEFILFFIDSLHTSISRKIKIEITGSVKNERDDLAVKCFNYLTTIYENNEYSEIMNLFYGVSLSKITDITGNISHSVVPESYFILDLPIPDEHPPRSASSYITLHDCFNLFLKDEILEGDNSWWNEKTGMKENIKKKMEFWDFPKILVISFKRFSSCGKRKRMDNIDFPITGLDLSKYIVGYNPQKYIYDLFGVCNHYGNVKGGHYTSHVLNFMGEWVHYNDNLIDKTDSSRVVSNQAYCLFYRRSSVMSAL